MRYLIVIAFVAACASKGSPPTTPAPKPIDCTMVDAGNLEACAQACDAGDAAACARAGAHLSIPTDDQPPLDTTRGRELLQRGCDLGDGDACHYLAILDAESEP
jgi:hypothetical protein